MTPEERIRNLMHEYATNAAMWRALEREAHNAHTKIVRHRMARFLRKHVKKMVKWYCVDGKIVLPGTWVYSTVGPHRTPKWTRKQ